MALTPTSGPSIPKTPSGHRSNGNGRRRQRKSTAEKVDNTAVVANNNNENEGDHMKKQQRPATPGPRGSKSTSGRNLEPKLAKSNVDPEYEEPSVGKTVRSAKTSSTRRHFGEDSFADYDCLSDRLKKTMYFANKMPSTSRPSFPLTMLAVNAFTSGSLGNAQLNTLEFLDLEMASEVGRNACVSPTALIMALVYLDRLSNHNPDYLTSVKPSELFVVALLVASKFIQDDGEDSCIYNDEWATSAKMETKDINRLELKFLDALDWKVNVSPDEFNRVLQRIEENLAADQAFTRGWFTYTELERMSASVVTWKLVWPTLYYYAVQVITAATITYTAILTTLLSSAIIMPQIYALSKALLATSTLVQGSGFPGLGLGLGLLNANSNIGQCLEYNKTLAEPEEPLSSLLFGIDLDQIELEDDDESVNRSDIKLPSYFKYANKPLQVLKNPNMNGHNIHRTYQERRQNDLQWLQWKNTQYNINIRQTRQDLPISVFRFKAIAT